MSPENLPLITICRANDVEPFMRVIGVAFGSYPVSRHYILHIENLPNDAPISIERQIQHFTPSVISKAAVGAHLVEAGGWAAVALWVPPGVSYPSPLNPRTLPTSLAEAFDEMAAIKKLRLDGRQYWYLNLLGRDPSKKEPSAVRALLDPYLHRASEEGVPVWLEATSEHSRDVYLHFGFKVTDTVVIGRGSVDEDGNRVSGGNGYPVFGMIKEPET